MRLDHIAYRVKDRHKTSSFFQKAFGYRTGTSFKISFDDGSNAECVALVPPEERYPDTKRWAHFELTIAPYGPMTCEYHASPEIFVSDGSPGSIVGDWVKERGGIGGVHHIAYQVDNVETVMDEWKTKGYAEFYSEKPIVCQNPNLVQVFTKPSELTGVMYEFITREGVGFCKDSVKKLMESSKSINA